MGALAVAAGFAALAGALPGTLAMGAFFGGIVTELHTEILQICTKHRFCWVTTGYTVAIFKQSSTELGDRSYCAMIGGNSDP